MVAKTHYEQIVNLYKACQNLWNAVNTITSIPKEAYINLVSIYTNSKKLMDNAYRYGITEVVSGSYRDNIENLADSFAATAYKNNEVAQVASSPMRQLRIALSDYTPQTIKSALKPKQNVPAKSEVKPDVKVDVETPNTDSKPGSNNKPLSPEDIIKTILNRNIVNFYLIPKEQYEKDKNIFDSQGIQFVPNLGLVAPNQVNIAKKIINEHWVKDPMFGYLSQNDYNVLKSKGYIT